MSKANGVYLFTAVLILSTSAFFAFDSPYLYEHVSPCVPFIALWFFFFSLGALARAAFMKHEVDEATYVEEQIDDKDRANIRTYEKWINSKLATRTQEPKDVLVENILEDLKNGRVLIYLLEVLLNKELPLAKSGGIFDRNDMRQITDVNTVTRTLNEEGLHLDGTNINEVKVGGMKDTLGLVWMIISHYQNREQPGVERRLIDWAQGLLKEYSFTDVITVNDITTSWQDGLAFLYILYVFSPNVRDNVEKVKEMEKLERLEYVFSVAENEFNVARLLEPSEVVLDQNVLRNQDAEWRLIFKNFMTMYLFSLYEALRDKKRFTISTESGLSEWRMKYNIVIELIESTEKKLITEGEPATDYEDLLKKCSEVEEMVKALSTYETEVVWVLEKGEQLAKDQSIEENDRTQTETDTKALRERWDKLKKDAEEQKKRLIIIFIESRLREWRKKYNIVIEWIESTEKKLITEGEPATDYEDLDLEEMVKALSDYETEVVLVLEEGEQLAKDPSIEENDRIQTETDTKALRERWDKLKKDAEEQKKRLIIIFIKSRLCEWRKKYNIVIEWIESTEKKLITEGEPATDYEDLDLEEMAKALSAYETEVVLVLEEGEQLAKDPSIEENDRIQTETDTKALRERWDKLKKDAEEQKKRLIIIFIESRLREWRKKYNIVIEWIESTEKKLITEGEPATDYEDLDLEEMVKTLSTYETEVVLVLEKGEQLAKDPSIEENDRIQTETDTKALRERWDKLKKDAEEQKKRLTTESGLSEWRKKYNIVIEWIESTEKKLITEGEPATDYEDLLKKCSELEEMVKALSAYETKVVWVLKKGEQLAKDQSIEENDRTQTETDTEALRERWGKRVVLAFFNNTLSQCSHNVIKFHKTVRSLRPPANDLPGVRVQCALLKTLERRTKEEDTKLTDIQEELNKMVDTNVLPQDAGNLKNRCEEVRKELQDMMKAIAETKRKLEHAFLVQYHRMQEEVTEWLERCERNERNVNIDNLIDLDKTYTQFTKIKQVKFLFKKGEPKYITLGEVHKEAVEILIGKEKSAAELQLDSLTTRHDELQKRLNEKEQNLHLILTQFMDEILNSVEEKVKEGETWVEPEDPADSFAKAKEQQDLMKKRQLIIKGQQTELLNELKRVDEIATSNLLPEKERSAIHRRIIDLKQRHMSTIHAAKDKAYKIQVNFVLLLRSEMERRKAWLLDHETSVGPTDTNFKNFNEFKEKYDNQLDFKEELDANNIGELLKEVDKIEGIEPSVKEELRDLDQSWNTLHKAFEGNSSLYKKIMISWEEFHEHLLTLLEWVNEKERQLSECKNQVNFVEKGKVKKQIQQLKVLKDEAKAQGEPQQTKLNKSGKKLIDHLGKDSPAAAEVTKQMEEVDSCRKDFNNVVEQRHDKIEAGESKIGNFYSDMDDVTDWLDSTDSLIYTSDDKMPQGDDETKKEKFQIVKDYLLVKRKQVSEKQETIDNVVKCVKDLDGELDESSMEIAEAKVNKLTDRWNIVIKRMETFLSQEILSSN